MPTTNLGITYLDVAQQQKEVSINAAFDVIDAGAVVKAEANTITGSVKITRTAVATGNPSADWWIVAPADTGLTASTESIDELHDFSATRQFATGALTTQRAARFIAPTYGFVGASTLTTSATVSISGAPIAGVNATLTNSYALWLETGGLQVGSQAVAALVGISRATVSSGTPNPLLGVTSVADTNLTLSTESSSAVFDFSATRQWATGALTTQRAMRVLAPTYAFVGASTITDASTVSIGGAPIAGTNATITNAYGLRIEGGGVRITGHNRYDGGSQPTVTAGTGAGGSPPAPVVTADSNDTRGFISFGTGTAPGGGPVCRITYAVPYTATPYVFIQGVDDSLSGFTISVANHTNVHFDVYFHTAPGANLPNTTFILYYLIIG